MRNFPVFTTENGAASLILREIPYQKKAYIRIQASQTPGALIRECADFCRAAGAEQVYGTGDAYLEKFPFYTSVLRMTCLKDSLPQTDAVLAGVTQRTLSQWLEIYNRKMGRVPNSAYMTGEDGKKMLQKGGGFFAYKEQALLGIGLMSGGKIEAVASVYPGGGRETVLALCQNCREDTITLEVASANTRAVGLYEGLGFQVREELSRWYQIP